MPVVEGLKRLGEWILPSHLRTAFKGATPNQLFGLYGWRIAALLVFVALLVSFAYPIFMLLSAVALGCLAVGWKKPEAFRFLFGDQANKATVGWTFGVLQLVFAGLGSALEPKQAVSPQEVATKRAQVRAQEEARAAEQRAKEAEARAVKAEKAAAVAKAARQKAEVSNKTRSASADAAREERDSGASRGAPVPKDDGLPDNVAVLTIPGVGKRQVGEVDNVAYTVLRAETTARIGSTQAGGVFLVLRVGAINNDKKTHNVTTNIMKLLDDQDRQFSISAEGNTALLASGDQSAQFLTAQVQPGVTKQFSLVYDVPENVSGLKLKIPAGTFSFGKDAVIALPVIDE